MKKTKKGCMDACCDSTDSVVIRKNELKSLYKKIREYEEMLDIYRKEKELYMKLLQNKLS